MASAASYSSRISVHASQSTKDSIFPGQNYQGIAEYLRQPDQNDSKLNYYQPAAHNGKFATLYDFNSFSSSRTRELSSIEEFESLIEKHLQEERCSVLLFLRGYPSPDWLNSVGSKCSIDPEFFQRHVDFWSTKGMPNYFVLPPLLSSSSNMVRLALTTIGSREGRGNRGGQTCVKKLREESALEFTEYLRSLRTGTKDAFRTGHSLVRHLEIYDETHFTLEQDVSICVNKIANGWIGIIWLDVGGDLSLNPNGRWFNPLCGDLYPTFRYRPITSWFDDSYDTSLCPSSQDKFCQSASLLHQNYGILLKPELAAVDAFYALSEVFTFVALSERQFLNMVESKIIQEIDTLNNMDIVPSLSNLIHSKRVLTRHVSLLEENLAFIEAKANLDDEILTDSTWPQSEEQVNRQEVKVIGRMLQRDFKNLLDQAKELSDQCDKGMNVFMNSTMIMESKRAIRQAEGVAKLTRLALFYVPLSFTTGFFGMNFYQFGTGRLSIWVYFVISFPILAVTLIFLFDDTPARLLKQLIKISRFLRMISRRTQ